MEVKERAVKETRIRVAAVRLVRNRRLRRLEMPREMAAAVAPRRPTSASWRPAVERFIFWISALNLEMMSTMTAEPMARITKARKMM